MIGPTLARCSEIGIDKYVDVLYNLHTFAYIYGGIGMAKVHYTMSIDVGLLERLKALAAREERPQAYFIDKALREYLDRHYLEAGASQAELVESKRRVDKRSRK